MRRALLAAILFNVYALTIVQSFWAATPFVFHARELATLNAQGIAFRFADWGFHEHYIWRLTAALVSTVIAAYICGAFARTNGARVASVANVPSLVGWAAFAIFLLYFIEGGDLVGNESLASYRLGFGVVSVIAIPLTAALAFAFGSRGELAEQMNGEPGRTLGVRDIHWAWMWLPLNYYGYKILLFSAAFIGMKWRLLFDQTSIGIVLTLLGLGTMLVWFAPLVISYLVLAGMLASDRSRYVKAAIVTLILVGGFAIATVASQMLGNLLGKFGY